MLPLYAKASTALARNASYSGVLPIMRLERLTAALLQPLVDVDGQAAVLDVELRVRRDLSRAATLEGRIRGALPLTCQRCLRPFAWPLNAIVELRLVFNEDEENRVLKDAEPYLVSDDMLPLHPIVEEEVLLALPFAPTCTRPDCQTGATPEG